MRKYKINLEQMRKKYPNGGVWTFDDINTKGIYLGSGLSVKEVNPNIFEKLTDNSLKEIIWTKDWKDIWKATKEGIFQIER